MLPNQINGVLLDLDGTLYVGDRIIDGAIQLIEHLEHKKVPYACLTNITSRPRAAVLERLGRLGLSIQADRVLTAPMATKRYLDDHGIGRCYFLTRPPLIEDFQGHPQSDDGAQAVVVGDLGKFSSFEHLNTAFRLVLGGAPLITMTRSLYFKSAEGMVLDAGAFVNMLESATGRTAITTGKPAKPFFQAALEQIECSPEHAVMVGDDVSGDIGGAQAAGIAGVLTMTGKTSQKPDTQAGVQPDLVIESVRELIDLI
ncbi:MAG: TIGR01458 family HAD-type hydrolase [Planctomycetota bacterium]